MVYAFNYEWKGTHPSITMLWLGNTEGSFFLRINYFKLLEIFLFCLIFSPRFWHFSDEVNIRISTTLARHQENTNV